MSSEDTKKIISGLKEVKNQTKEVVTKSVGRVWTDLISPRLIAILFFLYSVLIHGDLIGTLITTVMDFLESILGYALSKELTQLLTAIATFNIYLILLFFIFLKEEARDESLQKLFYLTIIVIFFSVVWTNYSLNHQDKSGEELIGQVIQDGGENSLSFWDSFVCGTYGRIIRDPKCLTIENTQSAEVKSSIRITSSKDENPRETIRLDSPQDSFEVVYNILADPKTQITINNIKCLTQKNKNKPFFVLNISDIVYGGDLVDYDCKDLAKQMTKKEEIHDISTEIEFKIKQKFIYEIPVINCKNSKNQLLINSENRDCINLEDKIEDNSNIDIKVEDLIKSSEGIEISVLGLKNDLPIFIGDEKSEERELILLFKKNKNLGNVKKFEFIEDLKIPSSLSIKESELKKSHINKFVESGEELEINIKLGENDNAIENNPGQVNYESIEFEAEITFIKTIKSNYQNIKFIKDYEEEEKSTNLSNTNNSTKN